MFTVYVQLVLSIGSFCLNVYSHVSKNRQHRRDDNSSDDA